MRVFRTQKITLLLIVLLAIVLRVAYVAWNWSRHPTVMGREAEQIATSILAGKGFSSPFGVPSGPSAWLTPVYPYIVAGIFKLFGPDSALSHRVLIGLNEFFSALTCIPIFFIGRRIGGRRLAVAASLLWAIFPIAQLVSLMALWYTSLSALLVASTVWATVAVLHSSRYRDWIGYGLLWVLGIMTNAAVFSLVPFFLAWLVLMRYRPSRSLRSAWMPFIALATIAVGCTPWTVRNYIAFGEFIPFRSNFGPELWYYNVPRAQHPIFSQSERALFAQMGESEYARDRGHRATVWILAVARTNPRGLLQNIGTNFVGMWLGNKHPLNNMRTNGFYSAVDLLLCSLAITGLLLWIQHHPEYFWLFVSALFVFPIVYYVTTGLDFYRHPIDPILIVLSGYPLARFSWSRRKLGLSAGAAVNAEESTRAKELVPEKSFMRPLGSGSRVLGRRGAVTTHECA